MKYFFDTEFIEGWWDAVFYKKRHFIDLISIGIVAEDGRQYHAISNEWNYNDASDWVKENVIIPLYIDTVHGDMRNKCKASNFHKIFGKSNKDIATEITMFCNPVNEDVFTDHEFYAYYADYDWVLFCSLFGTMMQLPKGFPMYCKDLKQYFDDAQSKEEYDLKENGNYPKQENEHNALADAKWNKKLYEFLTA